MDWNYIAYIDNSLSEAEAEDLRKKLAAMPGVDSAIFLKQKQGKPRRIKVSYLKCEAGFSVSALQTTSGVTKVRDGNWLFDLFYFFGNIFT